MNSKVVIGLFGTCGSSTWRTGIIDRYDAIGVSYFNPNRPDWTHSCIAEENKHLIEDDIILFPVLEETTGTGSLGEIGFSILEAMRNLTQDRYLIVLIDHNCTDPKADPKAVKESINTRALVRSKVQNCNIKNVFLVRTLDEMYELSIKLYTVLEDLKEIRWHHEQDYIDYIAKHKG